MATPLPQNRATFTAGEVARATGGRLCELDPDRPLVGVSTDSRAVEPGGLFVALVGEVHDGHRFTADTAARGAVNLVSPDRGVSGPRIEVPDTLVALGDLARAFVDRERGDRPLPVLAIGGAAGKTTTKTLAAAAVRSLFGETLVTAGNLNNRIGVPMTLLTLSSAHQAMVLECGTSVPGEIAELGRIARPDVSVVINVDVEHSERLGTLSEIADEEAALLFAARRAAIANGDDPLLRDRLSSASAERLTFGGDPAADLAIVRREIDRDGGATVFLRARAGAFAALGEEAIELRFPTSLVGETAAPNIAAAVAGALALVDRSLSLSDLEALRAAIAGVEAVPGRLRPLEAAGRRVLDDSYNSNPRSARASLAAARELAGRRGGRLVVALGDMLELGELAAAEHSALLNAADQSGAALLLLVGEEFGRALARREEPPVTPYRQFPDSLRAAAEIAHLTEPGDLLLVKGSRGVRMERIFEALDLHLAGNHA